MKNDRKTRIKSSWQALVVVIITTTVTFAIPYLLQSFICLDFNPCNWSESQKLVPVITATVGSIISVLVGVAMIVDIE